MSSTRGDSDGNGSPTNASPDDAGRGWGGLRCRRGRKPQSGRLRLRGSTSAGAAAAGADQLNASGAVTDEEFAAAKANILGI